MAGRLSWEEKWWRSEAVFLDGLGYFLVRVPQGGACCCSWDCSCMGSSGEGRTQEAAQLCWAELAWRGTEGRKGLTIVIWGQPVAIRIAGFLGCGMWGVSQ